MLTAGLLAIPRWVVSAALSVVGIYQAGGLTTKCRIGSTVSPREAPTERGHNASCNPCDTVGMTNSQAEHTCAECGAPIYFVHAEKPRGSNFDYSNAPKFQDRWVCESRDPKCERPIRPS